MVKNKIHTYDFPTGMFGEKLKLVWGVSYIEAQKFCQESWDDTIEIDENEPSGAVFWGDGGASYRMYIYLEDIQDIPSLIHELTHVAMLICELRGTDPRDSHGEWIAYWMQNKLEQLKEAKLL